MGFMEDYDAAFFLREVGLLGVIGFMTAEALFLLHITKAFGNKRVLVSVTLCVVSVLDFLLFSNPQVLTFTRVGERTCYYANPNFSRGFHSAYLGLLILFMSIVGYIWYRHVSMKREKILILLMYIVNTIIILTAIPDTFLPLMNKPSLPASAYGGVIAYTVICYMAAKYNAFSLSIQNLSKYIYEYVTFPIIVFSYNNDVIFTNDYGKAFLGIDINEHKKLCDIFEISKEDSETVFSEIRETKENKGYRMIALNSRNMCSLNFTSIEDQYGETYCTICFVNDMSREAKKLEELDLAKEHLEEELTVKSKQVERITLQAITAIANTIDAKDEYTKGHSVRVADYSELIAVELGWKEAEIQNLKYIALLHDIGKIGVPDAVLNKPGKLTEVEFQLIKSHTTIGGEILKDIAMVEHVVDGARFHHERYDGNGYPDGLIGKDIPVQARIIGIADAYDAMSSSRVYRSRLPEEKIREQLLQGRGTQFDPIILDKFVAILDAGKVQRRESLEAEEITFAEEGNILLQRVMNEIDNQKQVNEEKDYLTQLMTRKAGEKRIISAMAEGDGCLALIDMDNLKHVNDIYGHLFGDYALKTVSSVLTEHRDDSIVARYGGDEFLYYIRSSDKKEIESIIEGIIYSFQCRREDNEVINATSLSIGLCVHHKGEAYETILQNADRALYYVKQTGKCGYYFHSPAMQLGTNESSIDLKRLIEVLKKQGGYQGTFNVEYREFTQICDFISKLAKRYEYPLQLIMVTVTTEDGADLNLEKQEHLMECMHNAIKDSLRSVDITTRFCSIQYLIILVDAKPVNVDMIIDRIFRNFYKMYEENDAQISYDIEQF